MSHMASEGGRVAVVTGAASGIGQAFARELAQVRLRIVIADLLPADEPAEQVRELARNP